LCEPLQQILPRLRGHRFLQGLELVGEDASVMACRHQAPEGRTGDGSSPIAAHDKVLRQFNKRSRR